ncbi:MAG: DoxX family protein [Arachnia sp.]
MNETSSAPSVRNWRDWVGLMARLVPGIVFLYAGITKITNIPLFAQNIRAYQLLPELWMSDVLAYILPVVEIAAALLLIVGLLTRGAAAVTLLMLLAFIGGIIWVWSQGISIDCGCFGTGGEVSAEDTQYPLKVAENVGMSLLCAWLLVRPRSLFSLDHRLLGGGVTNFGDDLTDDDFPGDDSDATHQTTDH